MKIITSFYLLLSVLIPANAQIAKEWLQLTPIQLTMPAFSETKDVNNKTFKTDMLLGTSHIHISQLRPREGKYETDRQTLQWEKATQEADTVVLSDKHASFTLNHYATYLQTDRWVKGTFKLTLFCPAEVYINNEKKLTYTQHTPEQKTIKCEFIPGKHSIIIKTVSKEGKAFFMEFEAETPKNVADITFSISPLRGKNISDVLNGKRTNRASLSHDGKYVMTTVSEIRDGKSRVTTNLYHCDSPQILYTFLDNSADPKWVPGQNKISYTVKEGNGLSLYTYDIENKTTNCLIKEDEDIKNYTWSPDRRYIIYSKTENYSDKNWQLRKLDGIEDRQDYYRHRSWLCKYDFSTGLHSRLTWGNLTTSLHDISPDGNHLIFSTTITDYDKFPYRHQNVYRLSFPELQIDTLWENLPFGISCSFSPDGQQILIKGGPSVFGKIGENIGKGQLANQYDSQLYIYDITHKQLKAITRNFAPSVSHTYWHKNGTIYLTANEGDYVPLYAYDIQNQQFNKIKGEGDLILQFNAAANSNQLIYIASKAQSPPAIYTLNLNDLSNKLWDNPSEKYWEDIEFGAIRDWDYTYNKNTTIDGRYYLPADFDPNKKYPLIVYYYGGTTPVERIFNGRYPYNLYAANGYVVYVLQPSGAIGYGQEYSARHQNNWGKITGDEIISATRAFTKAHPFIDASKVGCIGASYGGFTTMYLTTQTDIFACAISHAGISSISGYWGYGYWGYSYSAYAAAHSFPWNRKDIYVDQSPLFRADKVNTPILLLHGTKDTNVPFSESFQFYTALKLLGKETDLIMIKDADHQINDYKQRITWHNSIMAWFEKHLKERPEWWENIYKDKNL